MKVAIIMAGDLREFTATWSNFKNNVLEHQDCDVYMHCYNSEQVEAALDLYLPEKYKIENKEEVVVDYDDVCNRNTFAEVNVAAGFYQWRNVQEAFGLIDPDKKYDFILKTRYDIDHKDVFCIEDMNLSPDVFNVPSGGDWRGGLLDMLAISSYENMKYYSSMYNYMNGYTLNDNVPSHSEILLRHHLQKPGLPDVVRWKYDIYLRKFYNDTQQYESRFVSWAEC